METMEKKRHGSLITGTVGAFLGSLVGVVCIVVVGQLGYMASLSGLVMAVCAIKGYAMLGGGLDRKGAVVSGVLVLGMTYFANQLDWAISVAQVYEAGVIDSFRSIGYLLEIDAIEGAAYWGNLVMLYLFTLLGAVPAIISGLRDHQAPVIPPCQTATAAEDSPVRQIELYPAQKGWLVRLRASVLLSILVAMCAAFVMLAVFVPAGASVVGPLFTLLAILTVFFLMIPSLVLCQTDDILLVRDERRNLWRISLSRFNQMDTYRFSAKTGAVRALRWGNFTDEEQERAKASILRAISDLSSGQLFPGSTLSSVVLPLSELALVQEDKWRWKTTFAIGGGRKKLSIAKVYQDFRPTPDAESATGPVPFHWGLTLTAVATVLVLALGGAALDYALGGGFQTAAGPYSPSHTVRHEVGGVTYEVDSAFDEQDADTYLDRSTGSTYTVSALNGVSEDEALTRLMQPISEHRMDSDFESFRFDSVEEDGDWDSLTTQSGDACRYQLLSVYFKDGRAIHTGVLLSGSGSLFLVEASHERKKDEEAVKSAMRFLLKSANMAQAEDSPADARPGNGAKINITV